MENERISVSTTTIVIVNGVATLEISDVLGRVFHSTLRDLTQVERDAAVEA